MFRTRRPPALMKGPRRPVGFSASHSSAGSGFGIPECGEVGKRDLPAGPVLIKQIVERLG